MRATSVVEGKSPKAAQVRRLVSKPSETVKAVRPLARTQHDQRPSVWSEHSAIGKDKIGCGNGGRPIGLDRDEHGGGGRRAAEEIESEVAHPGAAVAIDEHVIQFAGGKRGNIGVLHDGAVVLSPQHFMIAHGSDQQPAVGKKANSGGKSGRLREVSTAPSTAIARMRRV